VNRTGIGALGHRMRPPTASGTPAFRIPCPPAHGIIEGEQAITRRPE